MNEKQGRKKSNPYPTQQDVASTAGVSRSTVAAAFSKSGKNLNRETRERVLEVAENLGYRPNRFARMLLNGRSGLIGVIHSDSSGYVGASKLLGIVSWIQREGYQPLIHDYLWYGDAGGNLCETMVDSRVEGVICLGLGEVFADTSLDSLRRAGVPFVTIDGIGRPGVPHFHSDKKQGFFDLTRHLVETGHRRLVLLTRWSSSLRDERHSPHTLGAIEGFRKAAAAYGLTEEEAEIHLYDESEKKCADPYASGLRAMKEILRREQLPDAVLCNNDAWTGGALEAGRRYGVKVPDDIALTGYDNDVLGNYTSVHLTTMAHDVESLASAAIERLVQMIQNPGTGQADLSAAGRSIPSKLIVRDSCGSRRRAMKSGQAEC